MKMRLQVLICPTAQEAPEYSFLEITQAAFTLEELAASIQARHTRLYPHQPRLIIHKLQDADYNDLDLEYTVGDVFSDKSKDKSSSIVRVIRLMANSANSIPPESSLRPQRKHGRSSLVFQGGGSSRLSHSYTQGKVLGETMMDEELESGESYQERGRKRHKPITEDTNDEESLDSPSFEQQPQQQHEESSYIEAADSLIWSTDGHQPPNRRLFTKPSSSIHDRNLASSLNKGKDLDTPGFRFTRTTRSIENQAEIQGTQASQPLSFQAKGASHPHWFFTNGAPDILSPGSSVGAKAEELTSPVSIRGSHSPILAREVAPSASTLDGVWSINGTQDTSMSSVPTQVLTQKANIQSSQQAFRYQSPQPQDTSKEADIGISDVSENEHGGQKEQQRHNLPLLDAPSTQLLGSLASQESAMKSPPPEKITDQNKLAIENYALAAAESQRRKQLEASDEDMGDEEIDTTDSETEQQMEEELRKVEEKARKMKEVEEARKANKEEARTEKEEAMGKALGEACKTKEEEAQKEKEGLVGKSQEEEGRSREEKARKDKEEVEAWMKEQLETEKRKTEEIEAENKKKAIEAAEKKDAAQKKKAGVTAEKHRKKQEQEELKKIEKEHRAKEKAEESERKKQEKAKQKEKGKSKNNAKKASEDTVDNSTTNRDPTPKAPEPPASQAGKKRQRPTPNESSSAAGDAPQDKKQKTTKVGRVNNPKVDAPLSPDLPPSATPKVVSALRKTSLNGTSAAKARRSVSFVDTAAPVLTPQNISASEAPTKVYPKTPIPPPTFMPGSEPTPVPAAKPTAKLKTPIPLPDPGTATKATVKKSAPTKIKAVEKRLGAAKGNKSKLSQEVVEESESESELNNAQEPAQKPAPLKAEAGTQKKAASPKVKKETVSRVQEDSDTDMDYALANGAAPKVGGRVTRAVVGATLHEPLTKPTRGNTVAAPSPPAPTRKPGHDAWNISSTSEDDSEDEKVAGPSRAQKMISEVKEQIVVVPEANPDKMPDTKPPSATSETESETDTTSPNDSESESDSAPSQPKSTPRAPSPKAEQIANHLTKALGRAIASNTTTPTTPRQITLSSQPVALLPPSSQKYKSLSQLAVEEDYPEISERLSSQATKKREAGSDSDGEGEEESSSESGSDSDSDSSSGANKIPNTRRADGASSADKKKSGGLGGFLNRRKFSRSTR